MRALSLYARKLEKAIKILEQNKIRFHIKLTSQPKETESVCDDSRVLRVRELTDGSFEIVVGNIYVLKN